MRFAPKRSSLCYYFYYLIYYSKLDLLAYSPQCRYLTILRHWELYSNQPRGVIIKISNIYVCPQSFATSLRSSSLRIFPVEVFFGVDAWGWVDYSAMTWNDSLVTLVQSLPIPDMQIREVLSWQIPWAASKTHHADLSKSKYDGNGEPQKPLVARPTYCGYELQRWLPIHGGGLQVLPRRFIFRPICETRCQPCSMANDDAFLGKDMNENMSKYCQDVRVHLATRDDDIFAPVHDRNGAIGMHYSQISSVETSSLEGFFGSLGISEVLIIDQSARWFDQESWWISGNKPPSSRYCLLLQSRRRSFRREEHLSEAQYHLGARTRPVLPRLSRRHGLAARWDERAVPSSKPSKKAVRSFGWRDHRSRYEWWSKQHVVGKSVDLTSLFSNIRARQKIGVLPNKYSIHSGLTSNHKRGPVWFPFSRALQ